MNWLTEDEQKEIKLLITKELLRCEMYESNASEKQNHFLKFIKSKKELYENLKKKFDDLCNEMNNQ